MEKNTGGPAFPRPMSQVGDGITAGIEVEGAYQGMTMRQYYKGSALHGLLENAEILELFPDGQQPFKEIAFYAGKIADAMIAEDEEFAKEKP